jgi:hypothetical protein
MSVPRDTLKYPGVSDAGKSRTTEIRPVGRVEFDPVGAEIQVHLHPASVGLARH